MNENIQKLLNLEDTIMLLGEIKMDSKERIIEVRENVYEFMQKVQKKWEEGIQEEINLDTTINCLLFDLSPMPLKLVG